ncbi:MAG: hypothetical protein J7J07_09225, partial [Syntrophobacterales bacterium]|nr:hypothetical protein [Syntrophobacterales bacterium]
SAPACRVCDADRCTAQAGKNITIKGLNVKIQMTKYQIFLAFDIHFNFVLCNLSLFFKVRNKMLLKMIYEIYARLLQ